MLSIIFEENAEVQDQYPLSLNTVQKADDPIGHCIKNYDYGNVGPSKIRLLQSYEAYEVLWIHVIDAICIYYGIEMTHIIHNFPYIYDAVFMMLQW